MDLGAIGKYIQITPLGSIGPRCNYIKSRRLLGLKNVLRQILHFGLMTWSTLVLKIPKLNDPTNYKDNFSSILTKHYEQARKSSN